MSLPSTIRVGYDPAHYSNRIGRYAGGQFMGFVVAAMPMQQWLPEPVMMIASLALRDSWPKYKRWYAVLHTFDARGTHLNTNAWFAGTSAGGEERVVEAARAKREEMIAGLGPIELTDVEIALFSARAGGVRFGLFDRTDRDLGERAVLLPNDFLFEPPWDGRYST